MDSKAMITSIILIILSVSILANTLDDVVVGVINIANANATTFANDTYTEGIGFGFQSFFNANGIVLLALGAAILLGVLGMIGIKKGKR